MGGLTAVYESASKKALADHVGQLDNTAYNVFMTKFILILFKLLEERDERIMLNTLNTMLYAFEIID